MGSLTEEYVDMYIESLRDPRLRDQVRRAMEANLESNLEFLKSLKGLSDELSQRRELPSKVVLESLLRTQMLVGWDYFEKISRLNAEFSDRLISTIRESIAQERGKDEA